MALAWGAAIISAEGAAGCPQLPPGVPAPPHARLSMGGRALSAEHARPPVRLAWVAYVTLWPLPAGASMPMAGWTARLGSRLPPRTQAAIACVCVCVSSGPGLQPPSPPPAPPPPPARSPTQPTHACMHAHTWWKKVGPTIPPAAGAGGRAPVCGRACTGTTCTDVGWCDTRCCCSTGCIRDCCCTCSCTAGGARGAAAAAAAAAVDAEYWLNERSCCSDSCRARAQLLWMRCSILRMSVVFFISDGASEESSACSRCVHNACTRHHCLRGMASKRMPHGALQWQPGRAAASTRCAPEPPNPPPPSPAARPRRPRSLRRGSPAVC